MALNDFKPDELDAMIVQCADALRTELESERAALAKSSRDDDPGNQSAGSSGPSAPEETPPGEETPGEASASGSASGSPEGLPPDAGAAPGPSAAASPDPAAAGSPSPDAGAIEPAPTLEALQAEYMKLPPDQKRIHYLAAKAALLAEMGAQGDAGAGAGAPPGAGPSAPPSPAPAASPAPPMAMAEMGGKKLPNSPGNGGSAKLGKSESELLIEAELDVMRKHLAEKDAELQAQTSAVEKLTKAVDKLTTPIRKSVKGVSDIRFIPRTEDAKEPAGAGVAKMSKAEIQNRLKDAIRGGKLSKADKERISEYNVGAVDVTKIQHLLVDAK